MGTRNHHHWGESLRGALHLPGHGEHKVPNRDYAVSRMRYLDDARMAREMWHL